MPFDILELRKNIEEKRLVLGQRFENFLLKKLAVTGKFFEQIFAAKSCAFFGSLAIVLLSILVGSTRDIGHDSAAYLDIAQKLLVGGKYHQDFFETNFPLAFCITTIPVFLAKFFAISPIIASEIFVNLVGIAVIYFSAKILARSDMARDRTIFNLIILSFAIGFFLRVFTLQFNEFATKSTYLLACAFPYISYHFLSDSDLKKSNQIILGILAAMLFCLKPHYGILVIVFEAAKLLEKKSLKPAFCLRNYTTLLLLTAYFLLLLKCFPEFLSAVPQLSSNYYESYRDSILQRIFLMLREDLFPIFLLMLLCFFLLKKNQLLRPIFLVTIAAGLLIISEMVAGYDQRFVFYSLSLPLVSLLVLLLAKSHRVNWRRDSVFFLMILVVPQFQPSLFSQVVFNIGVFWWVIVLVLSAKWRQILVNHSGARSPAIILQFLLPQDLFSWVYFILMSIVTLALVTTKNSELSWLFFTIILVVLIIFYQSLHEKIYAKKEFSTFTASAICLIFSSFISLHLTAIFNLNSSSLAHDYKSPNYVNDQMIKTIKNNSDQKGEVTIISYHIFATYPAIIYANKTNNLPSLSLSVLYRGMGDSTAMNESMRYLFFRLKQQINRPENQLIFVEKGGDSNGACSINFLEYYFRDAEFRKVFSQNYVFLNRIITTKKSEREVQFFDEEKSLELPQSTDSIDQEIEVYVRKK